MESRREGDAEYERSGVQETTGKKISGLIHWPIYY